MSLSLKEIANNVQEVSLRMEWPKNVPRRLKYLATEVTELSLATCGQGSIGDEAFDVVWNAVATCLESGMSLEDIELAFRRKIAHNSKRFVAPTGYYPHG